LPEPRLDLHVSSPVQRLGRPEIVAATPEREPALARGSDPCSRAATRATVLGVARRESLHAAPQARQDASGRDIGVVLVGRALASQGSVPGRRASAPLL